MEKKREYKSGADETLPSSSQTFTENGKKVGFYGCVLLLLGVVIVVAVMIATGIYVPFEGTEGVGP